MSYRSQYDIIIKKSHSENYYDQKEYLRRIISHALQGEALEYEYSVNEDQAGEQYKIAKADYEAFREKYSINKD